ncbi:MAG: carboxymuconolactone decarboxylase family protein [Luteitalea sp.]|nr:carboxymuconolactone decarboxylase family protein [Luteitalea sp.]
MKEPESSQAVEPPAPFKRFAETHPEVASAYQRLGEAVRAAGPLSAREVALVKVAISIGARLEGSTHAHARKARAQGIDAAALDHVAILSCPTIGFPAMMMALGWLHDREGEPAP